MNPDLIHIPVSDDLRLFARLWEAPSGDAIVISVHGMTEHSGRYEALATSFTSRGFHFLSYDQRGHGNSVEDKERGHLAPGDWQRMQQDLAEIVQFATSKWKNMPCIVFAHSMGTLVSMNALEKGLIRPSVLILEGLPAHRPVLLALGRFLLRPSIWLFGSHRRNMFQNALIFALCSRHFSPRESLFDWLSSQPDEVKTYTGDPLCRIAITWGFSRELLEGLRNVYLKENLQRAPKDVPVYMAFGEKDPISGFDAGVMRSLDRFRQYWKHPEWKVYPEGRHELHNDVQREMFMEDISGFIRDSIGMDVKPR